MLIEKLFARLLEEGGTYINIYYGADATEEQAQAIREQVQGMNPEAEVICLNGGQPIYPYIFSVE